MSGDLTRWNRAGLSRFRYVDGNAVTLLEALRGALLERFPQWRELEGEGGAPAGPQRALEEYLRLHGERGTIGVELARSFARACHVITEHLDAYANEGYLGTATQWENVRRLVSLLDYHPSPPASSATMLVLQVKPGAKGVLRRGFQVKHAPQEGAPLLFETLEELPLDPALNALRLEGYRRCPDLFPAATQHAADEALVLEGAHEGVLAGDPVIVENSCGGWIRPFLIRSVRVADDGGCTELILDPPLSALPRSAKGDLIIHLKPQERLPVYGPAMTGVLTRTMGHALELEEAPSGLRHGQVVFVGDGSRGVFMRVGAVRGRRVVFRDDLAQVIPSRGGGVEYPALGDLEWDLDLSQCWVGLARELPVASQLDIGKRRRRGFAVLRVAGDQSELLKRRVAHGRREKGGVLLDQFRVSEAIYHPVKPQGGAGAAAADPNEGYTLLTLVGTDDRLDNPQSLFLPPGTRQWKVDSFIRNDDKSQRPFATTLTVGRVKRAAPGELCAVVYSGNATAGRVKEVGKAPEEGRSTLTVTEWGFNPNARFYLGQSVVHAKFKERARLKGWDRNDTPLGELVLDHDQDLTGLARGRRVVVERESSAGFEQPWLARISSIRERTLALDPPIPANSGYTVGNTVIRGNVVQAGHGESMPERVLGSGDATCSNQEFLFEQSGVSFVPDKSQLSGMRADIQVKVQGETWTQVPRLGDSAPGDPHYLVRMTEQGGLRLLFGDGVTGRRLPTGVNNIRIGYRLGNGLSGNLEPGLLVKPANPDPRLEGVRQPFPCEGGNDLESVASLRRSAPASILTLERAVSAADFASLAASHSSVWSARAYERGVAGFERQVEVVVVPAQGRAMEGLRDTLQEFLAGNALPGIHLLLTDYLPGKLKLQVELFIDFRRFDPDACRAAVRKMLLEAFSLKNRAIGDPLYLSEVYQRVEAVPGVDHSFCSFSDDELQVLKPDGYRQVIFLDEAESSLSISCRPVEQV